MAQEALGGASIYLNGMPGITAANLHCLQSKTKSPRTKVGGFLVRFPTPRFQKRRRLKVIHSFLKLQTRLVIRTGHSVLPQIKQTPTAINGDPPR